jgi:hypothetical protein
MPPVSVTSQARKLLPVALAPGAVVPDDAVVGAAAVEADGAAVVEEDVELFEDDPHAAKTSAATAAIAKPVRFLRDVSTVISPFTSVLAGPDRHP